MHLWICPSIIRSSKTWDIKSRKANRPTGYTDEEWKIFCKEITLEKLRVINKLTKQDIKAEELANKRVPRKK